MLFKGIRYLFLEPTVLKSMNNMSSYLRTVRDNPL